MKGQDTYTQVKEITYGNITIRIHRPDLTEKERNCREGRIVTALQAMGREMMKA